MSEPLRIAIIGGGPVGIEALAEGVARGHDVTLFERGHIGEHIRDWGHVRLFTPFAMNSSERGRAVLREAERGLPGDDELLTGAEFVERYVEPLATHLQASTKRVFQETEIRGISRAELTKPSAVGSRSGSFILHHVHQERNWFFCCDAVLDCTGVYAQKNAGGPGGLPAYGECQLFDREAYRIPDFDDASSDHFAGRTTLVVGSGYSAATVIDALLDIQRQRPRTSIVWTTRGQRSTPLPVIEDDPLDARRSLTERVNAAATASDSVLEWRPNTIVDKFVKQERGCVASLRQGTRLLTIFAHNVLILTGHKPNRDLNRELQVHECYATEGPIKLAAALLAHSGADCLSIPEAGPELLRTTEPNYFQLGARSYGRNSNFLLQTGLTQVRQVFELLDEHKSESPSEEKAES